MNIERLRKLNGISQEKLASEMGVHQTAVSQWEKGRAYPSAKRINQLCSVLKCSPGELFSKAQEVSRDDSGNK